MEVQAFVAVMVASNYTYAETTYSQKLEDLVMSHAYFFEFLVVFLSWSFLTILKVPPPKPANMSLI
jgi:hypothetical protein